MRAHGKTFEPEKINRNIFKSMEMECQEQTYMMPRIGDRAPDFEAVTTKGKIKMSEFARDKWTVMFSHPADFTPVCATEMS